MCGGDDLMSMNQRRHKSEARIPNRLDYCFFYRMAWQALFRFGSSLNKLMRHEYLAYI